MAPSTSSAPNNRQNGSHRLRFDRTATGSFCSHALRGRLAVQGVTIVVVEVSLVGCEVQRFHGTPTKQTYGLGLGLGLGLRLEFYQICLLIFMNVSDIIYYFVYPRKATPRFISRFSDFERPGHTPRSPPGTQDFVVVHGRPPCVPRRREFEARPVGAEEQRANLYFKTDLYIVIYLEYSKLCGANHAPHMNFSCRPKRSVPFTVRCTVKPVAPTTV